jgi:hypothetical protein
MARINKPTATLRCPANAHSAPRERIVEFSVVCDDGELRGGLLSLLNTGDGLLLRIYRADPGVRVAADVMQP